MEYAYEVFLSYKNHHVTNPWVIKFEEKLSYWLTQELGGEEPRIFFDRHTIETGTIWPNELRDGIKKSKCLLCIWTPQYFRSKWCLSEWQSFEKREQLAQGSKLILPLKFHDGEHYPEQAQLRQILDVSNYTNTNSAFWETAKAIELEDKIKDLCKDLARAINSAPAYDVNFPLWIEKDDPEPPTSTRQKL
ncbi:MAG TPA: toll/interleukin-1 receptor domain-containing protein [Bacteroidia bacterium]|nr:toll/interleukin-1 receptor domain-containing protein [Bacteroidia bacterium]